MEVRVLDQGNLPGIDDVLSQLGSSTIDTALLSSAAKAIQEADIPLPATMGVWNNIKSLIENWRGRKLVREYPEMTVSLPWFECHVPHGGTTQIHIETTRSNESGLGFKIFGSGYSMGRSLKATVSEESEPRSLCANYLLDLRILPRVYSFRGKESIMIEILGVAGARTPSQENCPYCNVEPESLNPFEYVLDPYIDRRRDVVRATRKIKLDWSGNQTIEIGLQPPGIDLTFTLSAGISSADIWEVVYEFQPGYYYQPYRRLSEPRFQPPRWAFKS